MSENRTSDGVDLPPVEADQQDTVKICPHCLEPLRNGTCPRCGWVAPAREDRQG